jgi:hypothetical protein
MKIEGKPFLFATIVILALFATHTLRKSESSILSDIAPVTTEDGEQVYITQLSGVEYHIPIGFFRYVHTKPKKVTRELLMDATIPDMLMIRPQGTDSSEITNRPLGAIAATLITEEHTTTSFGFRWSVVKDRYKPLKADGNIFGLRKYVSSKGPSGILISDAVVYSDGVLSNNPTREQKSGLFEEIYVTDDLEEPSVYIICNGNNAGPKPGCSEMFLDNNLLYEISYSKNHLGEWNAIKSAAIKTIKRFAIKR